MNNVDSKRKINFIKSFWLEMLKINVYTYEKNKLSNFNTYLIELLNIIKSIKIKNEKEVYKHEFGLMHLLIEFQAYLNDNIYFAKKFNKEDAIKTLSKKMNEIIQSKGNQNIKSKIMELELVLVKLENLHQNNIHYIIDEIMKYVYGPYSLEETYEIAKSLTMDLIVELMLDGYSVDFLKKEVYKEFIFDPQIKDNQPQSLKQQLEIKREMFLNNNNIRKHTFIFRIDNLKTTFPFTIQNFTFYNPLREDINMHLKKMKTLVAEEGLLRREELEYLKNKKPIMERERRDFDIVKYTDAHAKVDIRHWSKEKAEIEARNDLEEIITGLRFVYNISNIKVSESKVYISGVKSSYPLWRDERNNDKYFSVSYRDVNIFNEKYKELEDNSSLIYKFFNSNGNTQTQLLYSLKSFHLGLDDSSVINKFHHYWVSLETLLESKKIGDIKKQIVNTFSELLAYYYYYFELINIYNHVFEQFYRYYKSENTNKIEFPKDIH